MKKVSEEKQLDTNKIVKSFWWTFLGISFLTYFIIYIVLEFDTIISNGISALLVGSIFKFFYTLSRNALTGTLLFIFATLIAMFKIIRKTIIKRKQILKIVLNLLIRLTILNIICALCSAMIADLPEPHIIDPLIIETFVTILFTTFLFTIISEKE